MCDLELPGETPALIFCELRAEVEGKLDEAKAFQLKAQTLVQSLVGAAIDNEKKTDGAQEVGDRRGRGTRTSAMCVCS